MHVYIRDKYKCTACYYKITSVFSNFSLSMLFSTFLNWIYALCIYMEYAMYIFQMDINPLLVFNQFSNALYFIAVIACVC